MSSAIECNNCGTVLKEKDAEKRIPCSNCGSKARRFSMSVSLRAQVHVEASARVTLATSSFDHLLLQTIVVPAGETDEGRLIEAVALPWFEIIELMKNDPGVAYQIPARVWEELVAGAYKKAGFDEVTLTPRSGDYGRDVIAIKKGLGSIRVIDQVKAYKVGHLCNGQ